MATLLNNDFVVKAGLIVEGTGTVSTGTSTAGSVQLASGLSVGKNLIVKSTSTFLGTIEVSKNAIFNSGLTVYGSLTATNISGTISTATSIDGGSAQSLLIQTSPGKTGFVPIGKPYAVLMVSENNTATWSILENIVVGYANTTSNLRFGNFGQIAYQTAPGITGFLDTGTSGYVLIGNGSSSAPSFTNNLTLNKVITSLLTVTNFADITTATISTLNATNATFSNNLSVNGTTYLKGDLYVDGTQFSVSSDVVSSGNKIIALSTQTGSDATGNLANHADAADGAGLLIGSSNVNNAWAALTFEYRNGTTEDPGRWVSKNVLLVNTTSDSTSYLTGALQVRGGAGIAGNVFINNTADIKYIKVSGVTEATSVTSGALTVAGGVGIKKNLYVGGDVYIGGLMQNVSIVTATFTTIKVTGTNVAVTITNSAYIGNTLTVKTIIVNSTQSSVTTITNNAVYVAGGVGIGGSIYAGDIYSNGAKVSVQGSSVATITAGTDTAINTNTGAVTIWNNSTLQSVTSRGATTNNAVSINNSTVSTGTNNGALKVTGGVGVGGNLNVGGGITAAATSYVNNSEIVTTATIGLYEAKFASQTTGTLHIINSATSFDYVSGALVVDGGVGIGGDINVRGSFSVGGSLKADNFYGNLQGFASTASTVVTVSESGNGNEYFLTFVANNNNSNLLPAAETLKTSNNFRMKPDTGFLVIGPNSLVDSQVTINTVNNAGNGIAALTLIGPNSNQGVPDIRIFRNTQNSNSTPYYGANITLSGLYDVLLQEYNGGLLFFSNAQGDYVNGMALNSNNQLLINYADPDATGFGTLNVNGAGYFNGVVTATTFIGNVTGNASTASSVSVVSTNVNATYYPTLVSVNSQTANNLSIYTTSSLSINPLTGRVSISSTASSTSTTTGALQVAGGVGIGGNLYVGGNIVTLINQYVAFGGNTGTRITRDGTLNGLDLQTAAVSRLFIADTDGAVTIRSTTSSTSTNSGALVVKGGVGIGGSVYIGATGYIAGAQIVTSATISSFISTGSVSKLTAGTDTAITTSTGEVIIWNTSTLQSITSRGSSTTAAISITNTTSSTSTTTGALTVAGGVGIGGSLNVGDASVVNVNSTSTALRITQLGAGNALVVEDEANPDTSPFVIASNGTVIIGHTARVTQVNVLEVHSSAAINSSPAMGVYSWGTLATGGGLNLYKSRSGTVGTYSTATNGSQSSIRFQFDDGAAFQQAASIIGSVEGTPALNSTPGRLTFGTTPDASTTPVERMRIDSVGQTKFSTVITATSTTTGALVVTGGVGIGGDLYVGNIVRIQGTATSTSTVTGALTVIGGVGIGGALYTGGNIYANGSKVVTEATAGGVSSLNALTGTITISVGTDTTSYINTTTKDILIWNTSTLQSVTSRGSSTNQIISITNTSSSTSTNTGALTVTGGVGIGGSLFVGNNSVIGNTRGGSVKNDGNFISNLVVVGSHFGNVIGGDLSNPSFQGSNTNLYIVSSDTSTTATAIITFGIYDTTSTSRHGGGILVGRDVSTPWTGGVSLDIRSYMAFLTRRDTNRDIEAMRIDLNGNLLIGSTISNYISTSGVYIAGITQSTSTNTGALVVKGGVGIGGAAYINDVVRVQSTTATTGTNTGALTVAGGVGIGGDLYVGGTITANIVTIQYTTITTALIKTDDIISTYNTTVSTSTITGALTVAGGVGIGGAVYIGTSSYIAGAVILTEANLSGFGVSRILAGTDTAINTSIGAVTIWNTSTLQSVTNRGNSTNQSISVNSNTNSTSTISGALTVTGGVGIGGNLYQGGIHVIQNTSTSTGTSTGALVVSGGLGLAGAAYIGDVVRIQSTASSTSTNTGALTITGGVGIGGNLYQSGIHVIQNTSSSTSTNTGALVVIGGVGIGGAVYIANTSYINRAEIVTTATIGNFVVTIGTSTTGTFFINNATPSISTNTGALVVTGGVGVGGNLNVGGSTSTFAGYVGIGTATPTDFLDVSTNYAGLARINIKNTSSSTSSSIGSELNVWADVGRVTFGMYGSGHTGTLFGLPQSNSAVFFTSANNPASRFIMGTRTTASYHIATNDVIRITVNSTGTVSILSTVSSVSTTTGALVVTGGVGIGGALWVGGNVNDNTATIVNIVSTTSTGTTNALAYGNTLLASYNSGVLTTTTAVILDSFSTSTYRSAKYFCQATSGTYIHISEISVFHAAGSSYINEYGISVNNSTLGVYDANISNGNLNILFTPSTNTATTVKLSRFTMTI